MGKIITEILNKLKNALFYGGHLKGAFSFDALDMTGVFPCSMDELLRPGYLDGGFRMHSSITSYNQDVYDIHQAHKQEFLLDHSHRDGHFRV